MKHYQTAAAIAASVLLAGVIAAQQNQANRMTSADQTFATKAAQGGLAEVELGHLATDRTTNAQVKQFGQRMVDDHTKANNDLKSVAANEGITLPTEIDSKDRSTKDRLSGLSGAAFDRAYMRDMVSDHKTDVAEFQKEADHGSDPQLKAFAAKTLPILQEHLKLAESTMSAVEHSEKK